MIRYSEIISSYNGLKQIGTVDCAWKRSLECSSSCCNNSSSGGGGGSSSNSSNSSSGGGSSSSSSSSNSSSITHTDPWIILLNLIIGKT